MFPPSAPRFRPGRTGRFARSADPFRRVRSGWRHGAAKGRDGSRSVGRMTGSGYGDAADVAADAGGAAKGVRGAVEAFGLVGGVDGFMTESIPISRYVARLIWEVAPPRVAEREGVRTGRGRRPRRRRVPPPMQGGRLSTFRRRSASGWRPCALRGFGRFSGPRRFPAKS